MKNQCLSQDYRDISNVKKKWFRRCRTLRPEVLKILSEDKFIGMTD